MEKRIVLQHWSGTPGELEELSFQNIEAYAKSVGADYRLLRGDLYDPRLSPPCQKLHMLNEEFDDYDLVVMLDPDMFTRVGMEDDIFSVDGIGMVTPFQTRLKWKNFAHRPWAVYPFGTYWGGAIWRLTRDERRAFRGEIKERDKMLMVNVMEDEGIMHRAGWRLGIRGRALPGGDRWCYGSYLPGVEDAAMIHIRPKSAPDGPKRPKIENYRALQARGVIA